LPDQPGDAGLSGDLAMGPGQLRPEVLAAVRAADRILDTTSGDLVCDATGVSADLVTVDAVAWIVLAARRRGRAFRLRAPSADLLELLRVCGLDETVLGPLDEG
jgi:STAS domain